MKSLTEHLWFEVPGRRGFINIFYGEFDGRRRKRALVKILGG